MTMTLEQQRAQHALEQIKDLATRSEEWQAHYTSYVKGFPASILANGLGQSLATLLSAVKGHPEGKFQDPHFLLYRHLELWLCRNDEFAPYPGTKDVIEAITSHDSTRYRMAQAEAMAYLVWLKKFAAAYLKDDEGGSRE